MEQKYCIKHKLSSGTYLAILSDGWRYDGSMIIEADNETELEEKINEARYDDRWVTMNGNHVLIGGNGYIKAGAGGRLTGRKFGMRFRDYEHGRVSKNGKRMIRQYSVVAKKNGEKRVKGGKKNNPKQITKHDEIKGALLKIGFKNVNSEFLTKVDKKLAIENTNQLLTLERKFGAVKSAKVELVAEKLKGAYAGIRAHVFNRETQILVLSSNLFGDRNSLVARQRDERKPDSKGQFFKMPCAKDKEGVYTVTHEYGHMLQNTLIMQRFKADGWDSKNAEKFRDSNGFKWYEDREKEVTTQCRNEIIAIAKKNNKKFKLKENISKYGGKTTGNGKMEFFAEVFANSQLGAPNELGIAMQQWLKQKGLIQDE